MLCTSDRTERRGRAVNTPASGSGGPGFKSRPQQPAIMTEVFCGFPHFLQMNAGWDSTLKLGHNHLLPNPFQFIIIHLPPYHQRYIVTEKVS
jgi:hypothetical protein